MEEGVINFLDFIKENDVKVDTSFNVEDFKSDFFLPKEEEVTKTEPESVLEELIFLEEEEVSPEILPIAEDDSYKVYKDISENFSCEISIEGAKLGDTVARLVLESNDWTIMFYGDIDANGKCNIPMKKLSIFEENTVGNIKLEVIADGSIFTPWEDKFKVKLSKRVEVKINETKNNPKKQVSNAGIKVKVKR